MVYYGVVLVFANILFTLSKADFAFIHGHNLIISKKNFSKYKKIENMEFKKNPITIPMNLPYPVGLAYDFSNKIFYVSDINSKRAEIFKVGTRHNKSAVLPFISQMKPSSIKSVVLNVYSKKLYWIDSKQRSIFSYEISRSHGTIPDKLSIANFFNPQGIALDYCNQILYCIEQNDRNASSIEAFNLKTQHQYTVQNSSKNFRYQSIYFDNVGKELIWAELSRNRNECSIVTQSFAPSKAYKRYGPFVNCYPFSLIRDNNQTNFIYWSDWQREAIMRLDTISNTTSEVFLTPKIKTREGYHNGAFGIVSLDGDPEFRECLEPYKSVDRADQNVGNKDLESDQNVGKETLGSQQNVKTYLGSGQNVGDGDMKSDQNVDKKDSRSDKIVGHRDVESHHDVNDIGLELNKNDVLKDDRETWNKELTYNLPHNLETNARVSNDVNNSAFLPINHRLSNVSYKNNFKVSLASDFDLEDELSDESQHVNDYESDEKSLFSNLTIFIVLASICGLLGFAFLCKRFCVSPPISLPNNFGNGVDRTWSLHSNDGFEVCEKLEDDKKDDTKIEKNNEPKYRKKKSIKMFGPSRRNLNFRQKNLNESFSKTGDFCISNPIDNVRIDIEDCCQMTLCETPCFTRIKKEGKGYLTKAEKEDKLKLLDQQM